MERWCFIIVLWSKKERLLTRMGKDERIQKILESWRGSQRLKEDTWSNVQLVFDYYGFTYERKSDWVCSHAEFAELAKNPNARELLQMVGLSATGNFTVAVTHGTSRKSGMVLRCYLNNILKAIELLEVIRRRKTQS